MNARRVDVHCYVGGYPFRHVPHPEPAILARVTEREGLHSAWVGHLPSAFWRDPTLGNEELYAQLAPHASRLRPVPAIRPDWPRWQVALANARTQEAPAVRAYPQLWGLQGEDARLVRMANACGEAGMALLLTVRFEDLRQRHPMDVAGDLPAATVRELVRRARNSRVIVAGAGREWIREVHWGLTPAEQERVLYDISWIWGPPEDHLAGLMREIGAGRLCFGTGWPLRLTQTPAANLELLPEELLPAILADVELFAAG